MSLKFLFSNVFAFHGPRTDGQRPHHVPPLFDRGIAKIVIAALLRKLGETLDFAVHLPHKPIIARLYPLLISFPPLRDPFQDCLIGKYLSTKTTPSPQPSRGI